MSRAVAVIPQQDIVCTLPASPAGFDYDDVPSIASAALRAQAARIRKLTKVYTYAVIEAGHELISVKRSFLADSGPGLRPSAGSTSRPLKTT